ncbi:conserved hypothetical protein [uncultured spirochete]|jgi:hypothetical protein|uniref:Uncharacterized protein n=1 Tax=uncultured spirochete TaxID=156406 RepID=A0A3P3XGK6_9SPIR|nr:hypothetical protein [Rectinema subterraneum]SLM11175.1 conserved hypothetical protein [uncultured spirochete]
MFSIRLGVPEMEALWAELSSKAKMGTLGKNEAKLYIKMGKAMGLLSNNPKHPALHSHEIEALSRRYGQKVWQSYLENKKSGAGRMYWVYGPEQNEITIIGLEPHPEDKKSSGYEKIRLSATGQKEA